MSGDPGKPSKLLQTLNSVPSIGSIGGDANLSILRLMETSPSSVLVTDGEKIVLANVGAAKLYRAASVDDLTGVPILDMIHPDDRTMFLNRRSEALDKGLTSSLIEQRRYALDGAEITVETCALPIMWQGKPSILHLQNDITDRKQREIIDRRMAAIVESSADGIIGTTVEGIITSWNLGAESIYGYTADEAIGQSIFFLTPEGTQAEAAENLAAGIQGNRVERFETIRRRKDDALIDVAQTLSPIKDAAGIAVGLSAIHRDVTEQKLSRRALHESEARYRAMIEGSNLGIHVGSKDRPRIFANLACMRLFGFESQEELLATPISSLTCEHDMERMAQIREAAFGEGPIDVSYEFDGRRKDGSIIPLEVFMQRITWEGEEAVQRTFIDLTSRKRAEEQLHQAQKMETVGQLTGGIAHDFNNLLTIVLGSLELMSGRIEQDTVARKYADRAIESVERGAQLTQRLLAFSRRQTLAPEIIDARDLVSGLTDPLRQTLGETVEINITGSAEIWRCEVDPIQLENAILNLAINARDAMPGGGQLSIGIDNIEFSEPHRSPLVDIPAGQYVVVAVTDSGTGMPRDVVEQAFDPFFTTKEVGVGSGLGLSMVYGFVNQSGGQVSVYSEEGIGTTVKLYLPRSEEAAQAPAPQNAETEPSAQGETILVVEDDRDVRDMTIAMLERLNYVTLQCPDGKQALEILETEADVKLLFTDVVLPGGMSGPELARIVQGKRPGIGILFTSGYTEDAMQQQGWLEEGVELLNKPFHKADLAQKIRTAIDNSNL
jgi:PAS domain S-box-containing protein